MDCTILLILLASPLLCFAVYSKEEAERLTQKARKLPGLNTCGLSAKQYGTRIVHGRPADLGAYPWMANLGYVKILPTKVHWACAGSLITDQYVITAAHCVIHEEIRPLTLYWIRLGELDLSMIDDGATPIDFRVEQIIAHEEYSNKTKTNDVALVKLKGKVNYSQLIRPICLPIPVFSINMFVGSSTIIAGWGMTNYSTTVKNTRLLHAVVQIKDTDECRTNLTGPVSSVIIDERVICASGRVEDACKGDSGGPLMIFEKPPRPTSNYEENMYLIGIVSYGFGCALPGYPGVYARVAKYMDWIVKHLDI